MTKINNTININIKLAYVPFMAILFFVMLNGLYNSLMSAYGISSFPFSTFLFYPSDLHADLVKMAIGYLDHNAIDVSSWGKLYQDYYQLHLSGWFESHNFTNDHMPPLSFLLGYIDSEILRLSSPFVLLALFYAFIIITILSISMRFANNKIESYLIFFTMLFSYPLLMILVRGNIFSFINGIMAVLFLYSIIKKKNPIWPIIFLAIAINIRPNILLLSPLFLIYSLKYGIRYTFYSVFLAIGIFVASMWLDHSLFHQYSLDTFVAGLKNYMDVYVVGKMGVLFNNSLYGAVRSFFIMEHIHVSKEVLKNINSAITISGLIAILSISYAYTKDRFTNYEFTFLIVATYTMITSIFSVYHLFIYIAFLLIGIKSNNIYELSPKSYKVIFFASIMMLIPKNYLFVDFIYKSFLSIETIINPIILLFSTMIIISNSYKGDEK